MTTIRHFALSLALGAGGLVAACHHESHVAAPAAPPPAEETTLTSAQLPAPPHTKVSDGVSVSNDILQACNLAMSDVTNAPKFPFDHTDLLDEDYRVLNQIGTCLTTGPLAGRGVLLTGHADNRGTEEYNMGLGAKRAHTVSDYLSSKGVEPSRMQETSRGELDAIGVDVLGKQQDRRVDITLK